MMWMGIDPGKDGAWAFIDSETGAAWAVPFDRGEFVKACKALEGEEVVCCLEKVGAMPKQGVTSTFTFGKTAGFLEGVLESCGIAYQLITPQKWKKEFSLDHTKARSVEVCRQLFPGVNLRRTERCKKDHDGMAEALLMALYAKRKF